MGRARLILTCGLPGSGKTTLAVRIVEERGALRLTKDEWQRALGSSPWDRVVGARIEAELWRFAQDALRHDLNVVLDFGLWARSERDALRLAARDLGVGVELHFLEVPLAELWQRVEARNAAPPWDVEPIGHDVLEHWFTAFEAPDATELELFDPPPAAGEASARTV